MQIKNIHLVNYRGMEDLTVEFGPGVNLIIGDNGAGKTSLLNGLGVALSHLLLNIGYAGSKVIGEEDIRTIFHRVGDITESMEPCLPVTVGCTLDFCNIKYTYQQTRKRNSAGTDNFDAAHKMEKLVNDQHSYLPLFAYQSAQRGFFTTTRVARQPRGQVERRQGYQDCLSDEPIFETIQDWCSKADYAEYRFKHEVMEYRAFKKIVSKFIQELEGKDKEPHLDFSPTLERLVYSEGENGHFIHNLSAGYQSILCLIMELAYRTVLLNPSLNNLESLEGVVLIDEIDIHLHPKWQWKVLGALQSTFPRVQFIVATHSPIVISSAENARLLLMTSPNEVEELPDAYGINIDDILELRQGSVDMPPELKDWRRKIRDALNRNDLPQAQAVIREAEEKRGADSAPVESLRNFLDANKWIAGA